MAGDVVALTLFVYCEPMLTEKTLLQSFVALAALVPVLAGLGGVLDGARLLGGGGVGGLDSHFRYLSGLLLGIGVAFMWTIPHIELQGPRFRLLTAIVATGGVGRLVGAVLTGTIVFPMFLALVMELVVTPALCLWQHHTALRFAVDST
jgi:hypothetical protein